MSGSFHTSHNQVFTSESPYRSRRCRTNPRQGSLIGRAGGNAHGYLCSAPPLASSTNALRRTEPVTRHRSGIESSFAKRSLGTANALSIEFDRRPSKRLPEFAGTMCYIFGRPQPTNPMKTLKMRRKKVVQVSLSIVLCIICFDRFALQAHEPRDSAVAKIEIDIDRVEGPISTILYGQFDEFMFEGVKRGLTAELIRDRSFDEAPNAIGLPRDWEREPDDRNDDPGLRLHWEDDVFYAVRHEIATALG